MTCDCGACSLDACACECHDGQRAMRGFIVALACMAPIWLIAIIGGWLIIKGD